MSILEWIKKMNAAFYFCYLTFQEKLIAKNNLIFFNFFFNLKKIRLFFSYRQIKKNVTKGIFTLFSSFRYSDTGHDFHKKVL